MSNQEGDILNNTFIRTLRVMMENILNILQTKFDKLEEN